ncbi:MAG: threo-3-hydroxy-L-aspartate ammonia-lyase [Gemmatimonadaceae bacterium]
MPVADTSVPLAISFADVQEAAVRLKGVAHRTSVVTSRTANARSGSELYFKCENLQRMGAFKFRGAYNALSRFTDAQRANGVIAFSSGNHAQAIALSARLLSMPALVIMPKDAPAAKIEATRGYGAEVVLYDRYSEDREAIGRRIGGERSMTLIPPFDHPDVMAGAGTAALELFEDVGELDALLVCVGGGGLLSGSAIAARAKSPNCRVVGVEPAAGNDVQQSVERGEIVHIDVPRTIADGAQTQHAGKLTFPVIQSLAYRVVTVDDDALVRTMRFFAERLKLVVEPTGVLGASVALEGAREGDLDLRGLRVGVIVSGGNVDATRYAEFLSRSS